MNLIIKSSSENTQEKEEDDPPNSLVLKNKNSTTARFQRAGLPSPLVRAVAKIKLEEPLKEKGSFLVEENNSKKITKISYKINGNNFRIKVSEGSEYLVNYPAGILPNLERRAKEILLDNFIYTRTFPLILLNNTLFYKIAEPSLKDFINYGLLKDIPRISDSAKIKTKKLLENFNESKKNGSVIFKKTNQTVKLLPPKETSKKLAILSLSFGKDSLLSYAISKEIGLDVYPTFINDMGKYNPNEFKIKKKIAQLFSKEQKPVFVLKDETDNLFRSKEMKEKIEELDGTNAMLAFALELTPLAYYLGTKYIIFGSERSLNDYFVNKERYRVYPSYDQSSTYMKMENQYFKKLTDGNIQILSLIEPIYNIAEIKILYHRYPYLLKYVMSCSSKKLSNEKWCYQCPTCAKVFLYSVAVGGDPKKMGIKKNLFEMKYKNLYPVFTSENERVYEKPPRVKEEESLAFLLATRNGQNGELIDLFKQKYLKGVEKKEKELRERYFGIHPSQTLPPELKNKVVKIYKEELKELGR
jgi:7-cyano-7-deazaguanine synthase in queuosine biosynthesis